MSFDKLSSSRNDRTIANVSNTSLYKLQWYSWTRMNVYLLRNTPSVMLDHAANVTWDTTLHGATNVSFSFSRIFLSIGKKDFIRCKGVQYIFILWLNLSLTNFYTTHHNVFMCTCKRKSSTCKCYQNKPSFCPQGDCNSERKVGFIIWCRVKNMLCVTNGPLNLTKTGNPLGNGLHRAWT